MSALKPISVAATMKMPETLTELLNQSDLCFRFFNIGRQVESIDPELFLAIENCQRTYPWPLAYQAWFAIFIWDEENTDVHNLWFLKLPLDEQGLLSPAARDQLLMQLIKDLATPDGRFNDGQGLEKDANPFTFEPDEYCRAILHASCQQLLTPATDPDRTVQSMLTGAHGDWQNIRLQQIADWIQQASESDFAAGFDQVMTEGDTPLAEAVMATLAMRSLSRRSAQALQRRTLREISTGEAPVATICTLLKGLPYIDGESGSEVVQTFLASSYSQSPQAIAALAIQGSLQLSDEKLMRTLLETLANHEEPSLFAQLVPELMYLPPLRRAAMATFRAPDRSEALSRAIGTLLG